MKRANFGNWPISFNFANNSTIDHHIKRKTFKGLIDTTQINASNILHLMFTHHTSNTSILTLQVIKTA